MQQSSKFLQITPYAMLEYRYNDVVINTKDATFARIYNAFNGTVSYVNYNKNDLQWPKLLTGNTFETTVAQRGDNEWMHFDMDRPIKWFELNNNNIYIEGLWEETDRFGNIIYDLEINPEQYIVYDTIRLHIVEGFNFENIAGMIIKAGYLDTSDFSTITAANYAYLKEDENIHLNSRPFILGSRAYNRYIEFKIPSLKGIIDANNVLKQSLAPTSPPFPIKFPNWLNSQINIVFYEVSRIYNENGQLILYTHLPVGSDTNGIVRLTIEREDSLKYLTANIQESASGDYFELFPAYQGQFIDDFLFERSKFGDEYRVIHDIELYEHTSNYGENTEVRTQNITFFQTENFNKPFKFRPIIEKANSVAFSIDYTVRLTNIRDSNNPIQTIRRASLTYPNAKKYGRWFQKIQIDQGFQPFKIVNKIVPQDGSNAAITEYDSIKSFSAKTTKEIVENYLPVQYNKIVINAYTLYIDTNNSIIYQENPNDTEQITNINLKALLISDVIYGQGEAVIYLHSFDNFIKFKMYKLNENGEPQIYSDIRGTKQLTFNLVFEDDAGDKTVFSEIKNTDDFNISIDVGEVFFKVDGTNVLKILSAKNKKFFITLANNIAEITNDNVYNIGTNYEVVIYTGYFDAIENYKENNSVEYNLKNSILEKRMLTITNKEAEINKLTQDFDSFARDIRGLSLSQTQQTVLDNYVTEFENIVRNYAE